MKFLLCSSLFFYSVFLSLLLFMLCYLPRGLRGTDSGAIAGGVMALGDIFGPGGILDNILKGAGNAASGVLGHIKNNQDVYNALFGLAGDVGAGAISMIGGMQQQRWQEAMRATAYQTMVSDLRLAGLNPALAFGKGSAGLSGTPQGVNVYEGGAEALSRVGSNARSNLALRTELEILRAQAAKLGHEARGAKADADVAEETKGDRAAAATYANWNAYQEFFRKDAERRLMLTQSNESVARKGLSEAQTDIVRYELPGAKAKGEFDATSMGTLLREIRRFLEAVPVPLKGR